MWPFSKSKSARWLDESRRKTPISTKRPRIILSRILLPRDLWTISYTFDGVVKYMMANLIYTHLLGLFLHDLVVLSAMYQIGYYIINSKLYTIFPFTKIQLFFNIPNIFSTHSSQLRRVCSHLPTNTMHCIIVIINECLVLLFRDVVLARHSEQAHSALTLYNECLSG